MKILVLQLARLGDIYMSWPVLRALKRHRPDAEIHLLVRPRFAVAAEGLGDFVKVRHLPTKEFLAPLMTEEPDAEGAIGRVGYYVDHLRGEGFGEIINLSYSPLSSWLTKTLTTEETTVRGYTRHSDGWLAIADDVSAFYHAQGGVGGASRIHLADLFAAVADVDLMEEDWAPPAGVGHDERTNEVIVQPGASEAGKTLSALHWARLLRKVDETNPGLTLTLIGSESECSLTSGIRELLPGVEIRDLAGQTTVPEVVALIARARLVIGADSVAMHIGSLTGTPCLNLSVGPVNPFETGPRSVGSWILRADSADLLRLDEVGAVVADLLRGEAPSLGFEPFSANAPHGSSFAWALVRALYLGDSFPVADDLLFVQAVEKLNEMNNAVCGQLESLDAKDPLLAELIDRADEILDAVARLSSEAGVFVRWLKTEKARIAPQEKEQIRDRLKDLHERFGRMLSVYVMDDEETNAGAGGEHAAL